MSAPSPPLLSRPLVSANRAALPVSRAVGDVSALGIDGVASVVTAPMKIGQKGLDMMSSYDSQGSQDEASGPERQPTKAWKNTCMVSSTDSSVLSEPDDPIDTDEEAPGSGPTPTRARTWTKLSDVRKPPSSWDGMRDGADKGIRASSATLNVMNSSVDSLGDLTQSGVKATTTALKTGVHAPGAVVNATQRGVARTQQGAQHRLHVAMDNIHQTMLMLPPRWRMLWCIGAVIIIGFGFTVLIMVPFGFTILLGIWTAVIMQLAPTDEEVQAQAIIKLRAESEWLIQLSEAEARLIAQLKVPDRTGPRCDAALEEELFKVQAAKEAATVQLRTAARKSGGTIAQSCAQGDGDVRFSNPLDAEEGSANSI